MFMLQMPPKTGTHMFYRQIALKMRQTGTHMFLPPYGKGVAPIKLCVPIFALARSMDRFFHMV